MAKKEVNTIDALFGSKTRVKLLHLFMSNPDKSFYVREITRLIDEQINSVRRELSNMLNVGVVANDTVDNKLYYRVDKSYEFFEPFRDIFAPQAKPASGKSSKATSDTGETPSWQVHLTDLKGVRVAIAAGILVEGSASHVDLCVAGNVSPVKFKQVVASIERAEGREINYSLMSYDEFYYRISVRDRFIMEILAGKHRVLVDNDTIVTGYGSN